MRSAETVLGIIRIAADTVEPGAPKGARPVRGGADGKVLTEQLASRLLHLVMAFETFPDATRVLAVLGKRLARYGLTLHPDKTRLIDFRFKRPEGTHHPAARGTTFDFLGFTHVWGKSLGQVAQRGQRDPTGHGQGPLCPSAGGGDGLVPE